MFLYFSKLPVERLGRWFAQAEPFPKCVPWNLFFFFFWHTGVWTQGLHLKPLHLETPDRVLRTVCLGWLQTTIPLISASWVARMTGVSHRHPVPWNLNRWGEEDWLYNQAKVIPFTNHVWSVSSFTENGLLLKGVPFKFRQLEDKGQFKAKVLTLAEDHLRSFGLFLGSSPASWLSSLDTARIRASLDLCLGENAPRNESLQASKWEEFFWLKRTERKEWSSHVPEIILGSGTSSLLGVRPTLKDGKEASKTPQSHLSVGSSCSLLEPGDLDGSSGWP
jgi:hypothetical protein